MGCGCLGPKKQKEEVYVLLITEIHLEAKRVTCNENLDLYQAIKERLSKKSLLRKLADNLSSHRNRISEAMNYNYRVVALNKEIENLFTAIIVAETIVDIVYQTTTAVQRGDIDENSSNSFSAAQNMKEISASLSSRHKSRNDGKLLKQQLYPEVNNTLDEHYFKLIISLFERDSRLHQRLLKSLHRYCENHVGLIRCESDVWKVIDKLRVNIIKNELLETSCKTFSLLLANIRDRASQELRNHQTLCKLIEIWLGEPENNPSSLKSACQQIIRIHFSRCVSSWDSFFLYEVIFRICDECEFDTVQSARVENLVYSIIESLDMKEHFLRGEFNYLLGYLSVSSNSSLDKRWLAISFGLNYESMRAQYKNMLKQKVRVQGFRLLNKWVQKEHIHIDDIMLYNSRALIVAFSSNLLSDWSRATTETITQEFFKLVKKMSSDSQYMLRVRIIEEFKECKESMEEQMSLLRIFKQILFRSNEPLQMEALENYLILVRPLYHREIQLEIVRLVGFLLQNIREHQIRLTTPARHRLCEYIYSLYESISEPTIQLEQRYQLTCAAVSCFKILAGKYDKSIILSYMLHIQNASRSRKQGDKSLDIQYCLTFLLFELRVLVSKQFKVPSPLLHLNLSLGPNYEDEENKSKIRYFLENCKEIDMSEVLSASAYNEVEFQEINHILSQMFDDPREGSITLRTLPSYKSLRRSGSLSFQSDANSMQNRSFEQVLDILAT